MTTRRVAFAVLTFACVAVAGAYVFSAGRAAAPAPAAPPAAAPQRVAAPPVAPVVAKTSPPAVRSLSGVPGGRVLVRDLDRAHPENYGRLALVSPTQAGERLTAGNLRCDRVYFAAGRGICLAQGGGFGALYGAKLFDQKFRVSKTIALGGLPSRARVSPDGRYGATTSFVSGHSYATPGKFSTQTLLIDMKRGKVISNLERFTITRNGKRIDAPDVNLWGVTFTRDSNRFYATVATGGKTYLIDGDVAARTARTLRENVECPSLSPDGTRIAYKKAVLVVKGSPRIWNLHVLDLRTMRDTPLAERTPIDDQAEWLDNREVLYRNGEEVWTAQSDGGGAPRRLFAAADSPAVLR